MMKTEMMKTEQQDIETRTMKKTAVIACLFERASLLRFRAIVLLFVPYLLTGCVSNSGSDDLVTIAESIIPEQRVTDYRIKGCDVIWDIAKPAATENGLYWLKLMDCTNKLPPVEARNMAKRFTPTEWSQVFKQSILIDQAAPSLIERRKIMESLNRYSLQFPSSILSLLQLWSEQQYLKINLAEQKSKYQRLQFDSDAKIDRLKETRARLEYELRSISRKLENLTDIERQLSSRKQVQNNSNSPVSGETGQGEREHAVDTGNKVNNTKPETKPENKPETGSELTPQTKTEANSSEEKGAESP
ncbi:MULTISPECIES: two-component system QseEF-associated lipoprotein QseG [Xenorhabdus]|uniref:two-component system QseEF-associated lipoprotein QseG n=2 Tax=Xenorhabdus TaxID=626 RepID=UPI000A8229F4|nr:MULTISPECIES: two-component system QseEF-associated lipoprotein QseG [Xenorhabdus]MBC8945886.1 membrane protein [Xenorhabdus indica]